MSGDKQTNPVTFLPLVAILLLAALLLSIFSARLYASITAGRAKNDAHRSAIAYVQTQLQAADAAGAVYLTSGPEGAALELTDENATYATRIYQYQGQLVQEISAAGSAFTPENAQPICAIEQFTLTRVSSNLAALQVNGQQALVAVRSKGGIRIA